MDISFFWTYDKFLSRYHDYFNMNMLQMLPVIVSLWAFGRTHRPNGAEC